MAAYSGVTDALVNYGRVLAQYEGGQPEDYIEALRHDEKFIDWAIAHIQKEVNNTAA